MEALIPRDNYTLASQLDYEGVSPAAASDFAAAGTR
jgi:hypothetical protein